MFLVDARVCWRLRAQPPVRRRVQRREPPQRVNQVPVSRGGGCHPVRDRQWRQVAGVACRFPAVENRVRVLHPVAGGRVVTQVHHGLREQVRSAAGRKPDPTAAVTDSQSVKACATVDRATRGYDAGKRINDRKRPTFIVLPRRWVVERTFAWITNRRRNARDYERHPANSEAFTYWANIITLTRRLSTQA